MLRYTQEKLFTQEQVQQLFLSVNWISGKYPKRLYKALMNSSTVLTVWDDEILVGLARVLDDTEMSVCHNAICRWSGIVQYKNYL